MEILIGKGVVESAVANALEKIFSEEEYHDNQTNEISYDIFPELREKDYHWSKYNQYYFRIRKLINDWISEQVMDGVKDVIKDIVEKRAKKAIGEKISEANELILSARSLLDDFENQLKEEEFINQVIERINQKQLKGKWNV